MGTLSVNWEIPIHYSSSFNLARLSSLIANWTNLGKVPSFTSLAKYLKTNKPNLCVASGQEGIITGPLDSHFTCTYLLISPCLQQPFNILNLKSSTQASFISSPSPWRKVKLLGQERWAFMEFCLSAWDHIRHFIWSFPCLTWKTSLRWILVSIVG